MKDKRSGALKCEKYERQGGLKLDKTELRIE
jgi:hypothetical protein